MDGRMVDRSTGSRTWKPDMSGLRAGNPHAALAVLLAKREKLQDELKGVEKTVYDMETAYLHDSSQCGSVVKGYETFLSSSKNAGYLKRSRKVQAEDRLFSLSSATSPANQVEEHAAGRETEDALEALAWAVERSVRICCVVGPNVISHIIVKDCMAMERVRSIYLGVDASYTFWSLQAADGKIDGFLGRSKSGSLSNGPVLGRRHSSFLPGWRSTEG